MPCTVMVLSDRGDCGDYNYKVEVVNITSYTMLSTLVKVVKTTNHTLSILREASVLNEYLT